MLLLPSGRAAFNIFLLLWHSALSAFTPPHPPLCLWENHCQSHWNTFFYFTEDCSLRQFHCSFFVRLSLWNHVVQGRFLFLLLISSLPVSLTFSSSFASLCLPIPTTSTSCSVYTLWEKLFQTAKSLGRALQPPLEQGLFLLCSKLWTSQQCFWVFNLNPLGILNILKSKQKGNEWRRQK